MKKGFLIEIDAKEEEDKLKISHHLTWVKTDLEKGTIEPEEVDDVSLWPHLYVALTIALEFVTTKLNDQNEADPDSPGNSSDSDIDDNHDNLF